MIYGHLAIYGLNGKFADFLLNIIHFSRWALSLSNWQNIPTVKNTVQKQTPEEFNK